MNSNKKAFLIAIISALCVVLVIGTFAVSAAEWWMKEVTYVTSGRQLEPEVGAYSRVFLPEVKALLRDGIEMDVGYEVLKNGESVKSDAYSEGVYFDLDGEGTYTFKYTGVDATNSYSFDITATEELPSIRLESPIGLSAFMDEGVDVPAAKIIFAGEEADAEPVLRMVNGNQYDASEKAIPESGKIYVVYSASLGGRVHEFSYDVDVLDHGVGFYDEAGNFYPAYTRAYEDESVELSGCVLNGTSTVTYTYSETVDLSHCSLDYPLIVLNNAAVSNVRVLPHIKVVDAHDPQSYFELYGRWSADNDNVVYSVGKATNQSYVGYSGGVYTGSVFGTTTTFPTAVSTSKDYRIRYYYDGEETLAYGGWFGDILPISAFDADYQTYPWNGFTTGEAYIVVERMGSADFICVESVAGYSLSVPQKDMNPPKITVDVDDNNVPTAVQGVEYPVFEASASDVQDSNVPVELHVFKGFDATSGVEVNVRDGKFLPYDSGYYTLVYTARDRFANETVRKIPVYAYSQTDAPEIEAEISALPESAFVGERITLPVPSSITGGNGKVTYTVKQISPDGASADVEGGYALISEVGENVIEYVFTDYIGTEKRYSFKLSAAKSPDPILYPVVMPEFLPSGKDFAIPELEYYSEGDASLTVTASLNGKNVEVKDNIVTPVGTEAIEKLEIKYEVKNATGKAESRYEINLLNGSISDRTTYFYTTEGEFASEQRDDRIYFSTGTSDSGVMFINPVLASKLDLVTYVDPEKNGSDKLTVWLVDSLDPEIRVRLDIIRLSEDDDKSEFRINGVPANSISGNFYGATEAFTIMYSAQTRTITDSLGNSVGTVTRTSDGRAFTGFPSGAVYVTFCAGEVDETGFGFGVLQINNQTMFNDDMFFDSYAELQVNGQLDLQAVLGDKITVPSAAVSDVFSPSSSVSVSVKRNADTLIDHASAAEPFEVSLDEYGSYQVIYHYTDGSNERTSNFAIKTIEYQAPEVKDTSDMPKTAKLNERIDVALPEATDDHTENVTVTVIVWEPNNNMTQLKPEEMFFTADQTGVYRVVFYVYDECFNYQTVIHEITVGE